MRAKSEGWDDTAWRAPGEAPSCGAGTGAAAWLKFSVDRRILAYRVEAGSGCGGWKPRCSGSLRSPREIAKEPSQTGQTKAVMTVGIQGPLTRE